MMTLDEPLTVDAMIERSGLQIHLVSCLRDVTMSTRWLITSTGMAAQTVRCLSPALDGGETDDVEEDMLRAECSSNSRRSACVHWLTGQVRIMRWKAGERFFEVD
jgi:hypothetical protein